tara:strand:+ start:6960 stop:7481 length:522 start_codon:yes stop_codon:yes gene_type:complete
MQFEAELKGEKYSIEVSENRKSWFVSLSKEGSKAELYDIPKSDYQELDGAISLIFDNSSYMVDVTSDGVDHKVFTRGSYREIPIYNEETLLHESLKAGGSMGADQAIVAGMPGKIVKLKVQEGQQLEANEPVLIMEAMKMENEIRTKSPCKVKSIHVQDGQSVESGAILVSFE